MSIDLPAPLLARVKKILCEHVPDCEVWVIGSRARSKAKPFSDLDLVLVADEPLPSRRSALLASAFEESDLLIKVDLIHWGSTSPSFRERIWNDHEVLQHRD